MGTIHFRIAVHGRDPESVGHGDIEGAFIKAGFSRLDAPAFFEALIESHNGITLKTSRLKKNGINVAALAESLRAAGLIVEVKEDNPADYRPARQSGG